MSKIFEQYIQELHSACKSTHQAKDRHLYEKYLAEAGYILSEIISGVSETRIIELVQSHDRLWGNTWLQDPVFEKPSNTYQKFRLQYVSSS